MKLSAILVSVNLVAVAMPLAAQATEEAVSDKVDWLKKSMAALENTNPVAPRKLSLPDLAIASTAKPIKLRPFVPNRRLPSARDLELSSLRPTFDTSLSLTPTTSLSAQQPVTDQAGQPLCAQISAYAIDASSLSSYRRTTAPLPPTPPAVPGRVPTLPGQVASRPNSRTVIPSIPEPPTATAPAYMNLQPPAAKMSQLPSSIQPERLIKQAGALLVQSPVLSPDERQLVDELVELNKPGRSRDFVDVQGGQPVVVPSANAAPELPDTAGASATSHADIGPPPFPLNLLPQDSLKEFVGNRKQQKIAAPPAYFGSWHHQAAQSVLPYAGFQTHLQSQRILASNYTLYASHSQYAHYPQLAAHTNNSPAPSVNHRHNKQSSADHNSPAWHPSIAVYPAYEYVNRVSMF